MKKIILFCLFNIACLSGCTTVNAQYKYQINYPETTRVKFEFLTTQEVNGATRIHGSLFYKPKTVVRQSGHIDIAIYSPDGKLLGETIAQIKGNYRRSKAGVRFIAPLGITPPPGSLIKLAFHIDRRSRAPKAEHGVNIAL